MSDRTKVHRSPHKQNFDPQLAQSIIDRAIIAHVGITVDGQTYVLPVACAPFKGELLLHGSNASRMFKALMDGASACITITHLKGLVLARSSFESSMHYESLMALGKGRTLEADEKLAALDALTDHLFPGRRKELRKSLTQEVLATSIVAFPLNEISVKISDGDPVDNEMDADADVWAGVLPMKIIYTTPVAAQNLKPGIPIPEYIATWIPG